MREKLEIKKHHPILPIFGLVLLLLLSPCKVRNFIQAELGVPQTNVLNKSQTTLSSTSCVAFDVVEINHSSSTSGTKKLDNLANDEFFAFHFPVLSKIAPHIRISKSKLIPSLPFYILYQKFQVYS